MPPPGQHTRAPRARQLTRRSTSAASTPTVNIGTSAHHHAALPSPTKEHGRAAARPNLLTVMTSSKKGNPPGSPSNTSSRSMTPVGSYVLIQSAGGQFRLPRSVRSSPAARRLIQLNKNAHYGRCGLMVSGPARTGKTTALTQLGKTVEVIHRRRHPRSTSDIPVAYITVPPAATPKMIAMEFAWFLDLPISRRGNITDITDIADAVCGVSRDAPCHPGRNRRTTQPQHHHPRQPRRGGVAARSRSVLAVPPTS
jgi:hypothetical protein